MQHKLPAATSGHFHAVRFYENAQSLAGLVAQFAGEGFLHGLPVILIATPQHSALIQQELRDRGLDVPRLLACDDLIVVDAEETLATFMVDGMPDSTKFHDAIVPIIDRACKGRRDCVVRAYGEMVDVLWKGGHAVAAIRLEALWNQLAQSHAFALLCGYSMGSFYKDAAAHKGVCGQHTHVIPDAGQVATLQ